MQSKYRKFASIVAEKIAFFALVGAASGIGMMIRPGPGLDEYLLHWDSSKIVIGAVTGATTGIVVGVLEARRWLKQYWETVQTLAAEGKDASVLFTPRSRARSPFGP
ncbi:hypothetical protein LPLAFNJD_LOCUS634 [Methylorubrum aminovorans]